MKGLAPFAAKLLLVTQSRPSELQGLCLAEAYHGTYGTLSVYISNSSCVNDDNLLSLQSGSISAIPADIEDFVWVEEMSVENGNRDESIADEFDAFLESVSKIKLDTDSSTYGNEGQIVMNDVQYAAEVLHRTPKSALIGTRGFPGVVTVLDRMLPRFYKPIVLSREPTPLFPVPDDSILPIRSVLSTLKYNETIASIVNNISVPQMTNDIQFLTGEDGQSGILSRHSFSSGAIVAANWLSERIEATGATCELRKFLLGFAPNVICRYPSTVNTTATVLFSAHYDSRGSFGSTRAPGADDDGSGTISILSIARTIARKGITFRSNVELVLFAGEEQGLFGSRAYSRDLREINANLTLMIQADMLAYHVADEPPQLGLPDVIGTPEAAQLVANISGLYSPELKVGYTSACCSDHQTFHEQGFPATQVFERAGPIADPMYHNSGDLSNRSGYDLEQVKSIAKVQFATLLHVAGFDLVE